MRYKALKAAFPYTLPIFTGFWFLGMAYGIYANASGFSFLYPMFMSLLIYGGSLEFVTVEMLLSPFAPVQVLIMALLIQARHARYLLSEECKSVPRNPRTPGRNRYPRHRHASLLETQHADIHRRRHDMLLAPASFCLCINSFTSEH